MKKTCFNFCVNLSAVLLLSVFSNAKFFIVEFSNAEEPAQGTSAAWKIPVADEVRTELVHWLHSVLPPVEGQTETPAVQEILKNWDAAGNISGNELFEKVIETVQNVSLPIQNYLQQCDALAWQELPFGKVFSQPHLPIQVYLDDSSSAKYLKGALRYYLARKLVQSRLDDEALPVLEELTAENCKDNCIDPLGLLIAKAVVCEHLASPEKGLAALSSFRDTAETAEKNGLSVPRRYTETAKLLEFNLKQEKEEQEKKQSENPQRISKQMDQVRRRLGKGKTDEDTQQAEKDVMKNIDKLIEKVEKQLHQEEQQENAEGEQQQGQQTNRPADDSKRIQQKAPGNVDRRDFEKDSDWGNLPPKEREEALLKIEKEFPAHYRDIIEQYFREMAGRGE
jgi:hypothetical protein